MSSVDPIVVIANRRRLFINMLSGINENLIAYIHINRCNKI